MLHISELQQLNNIHHKELLRQTQQNRLAHTAQSGSVSAREAILSRLRSTLVTLGTQLQDVTEESVQQSAYR